MCEEDIKYIVKENEKLVIATCKLAYWEFNDVLFALDHKYQPYKDYLFEKMDSFGMVRITATAKCHPNDDWDEATGKRVAKYRLFAKIKTLKRKFLREELDVINHIQYVLTEHYNKSCKKHK